MKAQHLNKGIILLLLLISIILIKPLDFIIPITSASIPENKELADLVEKEFIKSEMSKQNTDSIEKFSDQMVNGDEDEIRGIYIQDVLNLPIVKQPKHRPGFVSSTDNIITLFRKAEQNGIIGLLAHNYLAGKHFFDIQIGDEISIVYGDGDISDFYVAGIEEYQALQPNNVRSDFRNLATGEVVSATQLFRTIYSVNGSAVLQTCIANGDEDAWGRLFVIAEPKTDY